MKNEIKSTVKEINGTYVCTTSFVSKDKKFTYVSKFKSDLKGVAHQQLYTDCIEKDVLDQFKNKGCKNIETELKRLGYEVDSEELLKQRREQLERAKSKDIEPTSPIEKVKFHEDKVANLESELAKAKAQLKEIKELSKKEIEDRKNQIRKELEALNKIK